MMLPGRPGSKFRSAPPAPVNLHRFFRTKMPLPCFALLDDNDAAAGHGTSERRSRLYTGYHATLSCRDDKDLGKLLDALQAAVQQGLHAVLLLSYELGAALQQIAPRADAGTENLGEILLFTQCRRMSSADTDAWLQQQSIAEAAHSQAAGVARVRASVDQTQFSSDIRRIRDYIAAGDTYQVN